MSTRLEHHTGAVPNGIVGLWKYRREKLLLARKRVTGSRMNCVTSGLCRAGNLKLLALPSGWTPCAPGPALKAASRTISGRIRLTSAFLCTLLVCLGLVLGAAFLNVTSRNQEGFVLSAGSLAAAELS